MEQNAQQNGGVVEKKPTPKISDSTKVILFSVAIFSASIILASWFISNTGFSIRNSGSVGSDGVSQVNSVAVNGIGKIKVKPDMVTLNVTAKEEAKNAQEAQEKMNNKVNLLIQAMKKHGVRDDDISTNSYSAYQYSWWNWEKQKI